MYHQYYYTRIYFNITIELYVYCMNIVNIVYSPKLLPSKINIFEIRVGKNIEPPHFKKKKF